MISENNKEENIMNSGTLSPNPWDLSLLGRNVWPYTGDTRTEDRAPQGCDPSADSRAGILKVGFATEAASTTIQARRTLAYCQPEMVLTMGSTLHDRGFPLLSAPGESEASAHENFQPALLFDPTEAPRLRLPFGQMFDQIRQCQMIQNLSQVRAHCCQI